MNLSPFGSFCFYSHASDVDGAAKEMKIILPLIESPA